MVAGVVEHSLPDTFHARIRVAYVIDSLGRGGAEHLLAAYLRHLPSLGVDPLVIALQERGGNPIERDIAALGIPVVGLGIERLRQQGAYQRVVEAIERAEPDLVHTQLEFANVLGAAAGVRLGLPVVSTLHTLDEPAPWSRAGLRMRLMSWSLRRNAHLVFAVSEHARRHHLRHLHLAPGLVTTIHNGIETDQYRVEPGTGTAVRDLLGIPRHARVIVTVAVLRPLKGIDRMLQAMPGIVERIPDAHYLIVGDGDARADLEAGAARLGIVDRVTFAGSRTDVPLMLAAADLFALPSLTEALPTVVAEAMAAGLPVVATGVGGTPEMVGTASGIVVPPDDVEALARAVTLLLGDPIDAKERGEHGRRVAAERFDLQTQASRLTAEYRRLLTARRG